jgi:CRISPR-associated protein (TIGR03986 family)
MSDKEELMNPKHNNPTRNGRTAHAPYNFVPLPEKAVTVDESEIPSHDTYEHMTGYIECTLTIETPTYTRCAMNPEFFHQWADKADKITQNDQAREEHAKFFHLDDAERPVIPGSSLRGMVRTLVEIAGYGKMQWVTNEQLVFRAVGDPSSLGDFYRSRFLGPNKTNPPDMHFDYPSRRVRGGYLRITHNGYAIQPAKEFEGESFIHVEYSDANPITHGRQGRQLVHDIFVKPARRKTSHRGRRGGGVLKLDLAIAPQVSQQSRGGLQKAKLVESGHMRGRHAKHWHCAIYEPDSSAKLIPIPDSVWELYVQDRELTRGIPTRKIQHDGDPLFYLVDDQDQLVFFGPTVMFRVPYENSPSDWIPRSVKKETSIDLAEAIFGYISKEKSITSRSGRVYFGDAVCEQNQKSVWLPERFVTPQILASPKPTSFQHYLVQDRSKGHDPDDKRSLAHYDVSEDETVIRGHKLYWHKHGDLATDDFVEGEQINWSTDTQHTQIKPVRAGVTLRFRIYFENLREWELGALLWVLTLPGEPGKAYRHKIGMGKPLGLGSVKISPSLRLSNRQSRYQRLFDGDHWHAAESPNSGVERFIKAFADYVLERMDPQERDEAQALKDLRRIRMLLKMMERPGPDSQKTEYMTDLREFSRERKVLPTPLKVTSAKPPDKQLESPKDLEPGQILEGQVKGIADFGAFVDVGVGHDGLVHISELSEEYVRRVEDIVRIGQKVHVEILSVERRGKEWRISMSMKGIS